MLLGRHTDELHEWLTSCGNFTFLACLGDPTAARVFPVTVAAADAAMTLGKCAAACSQRGYRLAGAEFGVACFCSNVIPPSAHRVPDAQCRATPCRGNASQPCGGPSSTTTILG